MNPRYLFRLGSFALLCAMLGCTTPPAQPAPRRLTTAELRAASIGATRFLLMERFGELENALDHALRERTRVEGGFFLYTSLIFGLSDEQTYVPQTERWLLQRPESHFALLVRALQRKNEAWFLRSGAFAKNVSPGDRTLFAERMDEAERLLDAAQALRPDDPLVATEKIASSYVGHRDEAAMRAQLERALRYDPDFAYACSTFMDGLLPQWGGDIDAAFAFARETGAAAPPGSRRRLLLADLIQADGRMTDPKQAAQAIRAYREHLSAHPTSAHTLVTLADLYRDSGDTATADQLLAAARELDFGWRETAVQYEKANDLAKAIEVRRYLVRRIEQYPLGDTDPALHEPLLDLASVLYDAGAYAEAEKALQRALAIDLQHHGPTAIPTSRARAQLGNLLVLRDDLKRGIPLLAQEEEYRRREWGVDSHLLCKISQELANGYQSSGDFRNAEAVVRRAFENLGPIDRDSPLCDGELYNRVGTVLTEVGAYADAEVPLARALKIRRDEFGEGQSTALSLSSTAELRLKQGRTSEAEALSTDALGIVKRRPGPDCVLKARMQRRHGAIQVALGQLEDARRSLDDALSCFTKYPQLAQDTSTTELYLARLSRTAGKLEEAEQHLATSERLLRTHDLPTSLRFARLALERALIERVRGPRSGAKAQLARAAYADAGYPRHPELDALTQ